MRFKSWLLWQSLSPTPYLIGVILALSTPSVANPEANPVKLVEKGTLCTPSHPWLQNRRVNFSLERDWVASPGPLDRPNYPKGWWIKNWNAEGVNWVLTKQVSVPAERKASYDFEIMKMYVGEAEPDIFRALDRKQFRGHNGIDGFTIRGQEYSAGYDNIWFVLKLPKAYNRIHYQTQGSVHKMRPEPLYLVCRAEFLAELRASVLPNAYALAQSCSVR